MDNKNIDIKKLFNLCLEDFIKTGNKNNKYFVIFEKINQNNNGTFNSTIEKIKFLFSDNLFRIDDNVLIIPIFSSCDYKCVFCDRSDQIVIDTQKNILTTPEDIKFIIKLTKNKNFSKIQITGNEPLTNPFITDIILYLSSLNKGIIFNTSLSRENILDVVNFLNIEEIIYSIYGSNKEIHDKIVSFPGSFNQINNFIKKIKKIKPQIEFTKKGVLLKDNFLDMNYIKQGGFFILRPSPIDRIRFELYQKNAVNFKSIKNALIVVRNNNLDIYKFFKNIPFLPTCLLKEISNEDFDFFVKNYLNYDFFTNGLEYTKLDKCKKCKFYDQCNGYFKLHFDVFGENEINPLV
ncbi:MAG: radical SAM protein [Candidatus Gracilibacteria bacterium]|nr:radical SAM protein [Candidatus Gracilibacteria bacterium]